MISVSDTDHSRHDFFEVATYQSQIAFLSVGEAMLAIQAINWMASLILAQDKRWRRA